MNGNFTKWAIGLFTAIILALGAWNLANTVSAGNINAVQEQKIQMLIDDRAHIQEQLDRIERSLQEQNQTQKFILQNMGKTN